MQHNRAEVKILSLNGGGVRGLFTISVLAEIERILEEENNRVDVKIGEYFDLITGTSIGGLLALALASGKSARELEKVFREEASKIFPPLSKCRKAWRKLFGAAYSSEPLRNVVQSMVGEDTRFHDLGIRVMIPAINLSTGKPQFFKTAHNSAFSRDGRLKLIDAAMATSAAPTYFRPYYCEDLSAYFVDGGLVANNPSLIGMHEVFRDMGEDFPDATASDVKILNIGTLGEEYTVSPAALSAKRNNGYWKLWGIGERLVLTTMTANQLLHKAMLLRELAHSGALANYVYVDDTIPNEAAKDITIDNASESSLRNLASRGKQIATERYTADRNLQHFFKHQAAPFKRRSNKE
ncbi:MAG: CBASS cGAMP-activated phospholipase [Idiomarina sp.]